MMAKVKQEQHRANDLHGAKTICTTLQDLAARFSFSNPHKFRDTILRSNRFPYVRHSRERWEMRISDLPG